MPTYTWVCNHCGEQVEAFLKIREYIEDAPTYVCCASLMDRLLTPVLLVNTNDRAYEGLRASDGTDISTRSKHQAYMKSKGLAIADDFKGEWADAHKKRAALFKGEDPSRKQDIADAINKLGG